MSLFHWISYKYKINIQTKMKTAFLVACYIFGKLLFQDECWKDSVYATEFSSKVFLYVFILLAIACFIYSIIFAIACFIYSIIIFLRKSVHCIIKYSLDWVWSR